jgi:hypothetical protein
MTTPTLAELRTSQYVRIYGGDAEVYDSLYQVLQDTGQATTQEVYEHLCRIIEDMLDDPRGFAEYAKEYFE